jgi:hypothetical protein
MSSSWAARSKRSCSAAPTARSIRCAAERALTSPLMRSTPSRARPSHGPCAALSASRLSSELRTTPAGCAARARAGRPGSAGTGCARVPGRAGVEVARKVAELVVGARARHGAAHLAAPADGGGCRVPQPANAERQQRAEAQQVRGGAEAGEQAQPAAGGSGARQAEDLRRVALDHHDGGQAPGVPTGAAAASRPPSGRRRSGAPRRPSTASSMWRPLSWPGRAAGGGSASSRRPSTRR